MTLSGVIDDRMLHGYRELLEHAYEEGNRDHFEADLSHWELAAQRRLAYLKRMGLELGFG